MIRNRMTMLGSSLSTEAVSGGEKHTKIWSSLE